MDEGDYFLPASKRIDLEDVYQSPEEKGLDDDKR